MKRFVFIIGCAVLGVLLFRYANNQKPNLVSETIEPKEALFGYITVHAGAAQKKTLADQSFIDVISGDKILLGDTVVTTHAGRVFVAFQGYVDTRLHPNSEVEYTRLYPEDMVLSQKNGIVEYTIVRPVTARVGQALLSMEQGAVTVSIVNEMTNVFVSKGLVKISFVDEDKMMKKWDVLQGQTAYIDNVKRMVSLDE